MFNNFVNQTLYSEYHLFNKTGCKFTMTNVYFKKENDIILNGTLWKEVENKFMPFALPANHQKHSEPGGQWACPRVLLRPLEAGGRALGCCCPVPPTGACQRVIYCRKCIHLLYNEK